MELATYLVQQAVEADPHEDNTKAQLSHVAYTLATAATPHQQLVALEHAERLVNNARRSYAGFHPPMFFQSNAFDLHGNREV